MFAGRLTRTQYKATLLRYTPRSKHQHPKKAKRTPPTWLAAHPLKFGKTIEIQAWTKSEARARLKAIVAAELKTDRFYLPIGWGDRILRQAA